MVRRRFKTGDLDSRFKDDEESALDKRFEGTESKFEAQSTRGTYFWVWEPVMRLLFGPELTEEDAYNKGLAKIPGGDFMVVPLNTRNKAEASSRMKGVLFADDKVALGDAIGRMKHKLPGGS